MHYTHIIIFFNLVLQPTVYYRELQTSYFISYIYCTTGSKNDFALLSECNFVMIKYPRKGQSIPHERVFKMDSENLVCVDE